MSDYETFDALFIETLDRELAQDDQPESATEEVITFQSILYPEEV